MRCRRVTAISKESLEIRMVLIKFTSLRDRHAVESDAALTEQ